MLDQFATQAAVALLNRMLVRESWARERLAPFAGRRVRFSAAPFAFNIGVIEGGLVSAASGEPDVTIAVDLANVPAALFDAGAVLRDVRLTGDAQFAQAMSFVLQNLRPEPEEELARLVGDAAAVRMVGFARALLAQARDAGARLASTTAVYLVTENPMLAARGDVDQFARDVAALRDALSHLEQRVQALSDPQEHH